MMSLIRNVSISLAVTLRDMTGVSYQGSYRYLQQGHIVGDMTIE
jgi:hypothetical protein